MQDQPAILRFRRLGILAIFSIYLVILVGGLVRASGAGMGCPDWPTCFGQWIPPTNEVQLPPNYHEIYADRGYQNTDFNPIKTWTEYANRLVGVSIGLVIIFTTWASRIYLKTDKAVFYLTLTVLLTTCFQGWLGSAVVASNLKPFMITLHMLLALFIVALLIYAIARSQQTFLAEIDIKKMPDSVTLLLKIVMVMTLVQVVMGTQVREAVDFIANEHHYIDRIYWRDSFPLVFYIHRSFSAFILFINAGLSWKIIQHTNANTIIRTAVISLMSLIMIEIIAGVSLDRLGIPPIAQPIHLLVANLIFGIQFFIYIGLKYSQQNR
jgi:cytochrome c oxidase assembly protein subunit 15